MKRYSVAGDVQDQSIDLLVGMMLLRSDTTAKVAMELETQGPKDILERSMRPMVAKELIELAGQN